MKFHYIPSVVNLQLNELLESACKKLDVELVSIPVDSFSYADASPLEEGIFYRASTSISAVAMEKYLIQPETTTFYSSPEVPLYRSTVLGSPTSIILAKHNVPLPKAIYSIPRNRDILKKEVEFLGGFPVIMKILGGSHGIGVIKIDSYSSLFSMVDYFFSVKSTKSMMMEFIDAGKSARLIVLEDKVIDSIEYISPPDDFRSNVGESPNVKKCLFSKEIQDTAVRAVRALKLEFGGVDILIDKNNKHYVTEVNFPCNFARCQMLTGTDIAGMMVEYLVKKANR